MKTPVRAIVLVRWLRKDCAAPMIMCCFEGVKTRGVMGNVEDRPYWMGCPRCTQSSDGARCHPEAIRSSLDQGIPATPPASTAQPTEGHPSAQMVGAIQRLCSFTGTNIRNISSCRVRLQALVTMVGK